MLVFVVKHKHDRNPTLTSLVCELNHRVSNPSEEPASTHQEIPSEKDIEQGKDSIEHKRQMVELSKQEKQEEKTKTAIFFRIWFDLKRKEVIKIVLGSFAAGFSGISKPVFGFYIITIGVAYYEDHARRKVGWFSVIFSAIGLLSLFSNTLQHYFFGVVGEKAMTNLRRALYSGINKKTTKFTSCLFIL